jgi:hypothetical protein
MKKTIAFLLSIGLIVPIIIVCYDFFDTPKSIESVVINKAHFKYDYHVYLTKGQISLPSSQYSDYCKLQFGDTVNIEMSPLLKITHSYIPKHLKLKIEAGDYTPLFLMALVALLMFLVLLLFFISDIRKRRLTDEDIGGYYIALAIGYLFSIPILLF